MGLDAFVMCRCWQDGLAAPPPIPAEWLRVANSMFEIVDEHDTLENSMAVDRWQHDACPHPDMELIGERLANWVGYRLFQTALGEVGWQHFPALRANLPEANGGEMPAAESARVLEELEHFEDQPSVGTETLLADEDTGAGILTYVPAYQGERYSGPGYRAGVTPDGFFFRRGAETVFQAIRFQQFVDEHRVRLVADNQELDWPCPPLGEPPAKRLHVITRNVTPAEFGYIVEPLKKLCAASVATGNPVAWT